MDRDKSDGIASVTHNCVSYHPTKLPDPPQQDQHLEQFGIVIKSCNYEITSVDVPSVVSYTYSVRYPSSMEQLLPIPDSVIICQELWNDMTWACDTCGDNISNEIYSSDSYVLNAQSD